MAGLSSTGFVAPTLQEIKAEIEAALRAEISPTLDLDASAPMGQATAIFSRQIRLVWEALAALYNAQDPAAATGRLLDNLAALTGVRRRPATSGTVGVQLSLDAGTYPAGSLVAVVNGDADSLWTNPTTIVSVGSNVITTFRAVSAGPFEAPSGSLVISSPVTGWNSVSNSGDAIPGLPVETDAELRARRNADVSLPGGATAAAILADLRELDGVISANVLENDTDATDADGVPPHSIEAIVYAPGLDDQIIADQIYASKPAGTGTAGGVTVAVTSSQGTESEISFTIPTELARTAALTLEVDSLEYSGDTAAALAVAASATAELAVGDDLDWSDVVAWAMDVPGVLRVTAVDVQGVAFGSQTATIRQLITLSSGDITITSSVGAP